MLRKEAIRDIVNPKNRSQEYNKIDKKGSQHKTSVPFWNKKDYECDTNEINSYTEYSQTSNHYCVKNLDI